MSTLREAAQQALEALEDVDGPITALLGGLLGSPDADAPGAKVRTAITALRSALAQQEEPVTGIIESEIKEDSHQTLDDAMQQPRAMAQAYENGYKAGAAAERKRIIQFLTEMQRQVGDGHNHYGVAAMRIRERV